MSRTILLIPGLALAFFVITSTPASALSCLPIDMYLTSVIGDESVVLFSAKTTKTMTETSYTAEVLEVTAAYQGYVESNIIAYHENDENWGYLCNSGPKGTGTQGVYIAIRDDAGKYQVTQRFETNDELVAVMKKELVKEEIVGEVVELSKEDRLNQISTTIQDLIADIIILLKEQFYWKNVK